jgi:hypothetical protein
MAINRSTQQRQNYGLGSFVKKAVNKVTKPFVKVAQKVMPKELAGVARMAAPFLPPGYREAAYFAGTAKQKGRISPLDVALMTAPYAANKFSYTPGQGISSVGFNEADAARSGAMDFNQFFRSRVPYGQKIADTLVGSPGQGSENIVGDPMAPRSVVERTLSSDPTQGLIGSGGQMSQLLGDGPGILDSKLGQMALGKKDLDLGSRELNYLKLAGWTTGVVSSIQAGKYQDEMEAAEAAEAAAKADGATDSEIQASIDWAKATFSRLSRADIGLEYAQGGRVNYAMGTFNPATPKPGDYGVDENELKPEPKPFIPRPKPGNKVEITAEMMAQEYFGMSFNELAPAQQQGILELISAGKPQAKNGGLMRSNYALGTRPEPKESGLGGLPIEADMRYSGGFMPYGKKEKADDVPARLSKNEFVFTADAVRAAGGGSMNEGARRMYQTMKTLEQQNRMMS